MGPPRAAGKFLMQKKNDSATISLVSQNGDASSGCDSFSDPATWEKTHIILKRLRAWSLNLVERRRSCPETNTVSGEDEDGILAKGF
jgi:hypothetical protein